MAAVFHSFVVVASAGTAVTLASGLDASLPKVASWVTIYPRRVGASTNAGEVRIGGHPYGGNSIPQGSGVPLLPGDAAVTWWLGGYYDLKEIYVDADNSNDGIQFAYGVN